jgi:hypothetical protein
MSSGRWVHVGIVVGLSLAATTGIGLVRTAGAAPSAGASSFVPITPCRLFDTRPAPDRVGTRTAPLGPDDTFVAAVRGANGNCAVPSTATAVSMNVTIISPTADSFLTVFPSDAASRPLAASLNWIAKQAPTPNAVTAALSADGHVSFYNLTGSVQVAADVVGYYEPSGADGQAGVTPARIVWVATSGAPFTSVRAALASITDADTDHHTVVKIAPGTYVESGQIDLRTGVDIEGSGATSTIIQCACASATSPAVDGSSATMRATGLTGEISVRGIDIQNTGVGAHATGLWVSDDTFADVTVDEARVDIPMPLSGPAPTDVEGVHIGSGILTLSRSEIEVNGAVSSTGVSALGASAQVDLRSTDVRVYGASTTATAVAINGSGISTLSDLALGAYGESGSTSTGVLVTGATTTLTRVDVSASPSGNATARGIAAVSNSFVRIVGGHVATFGGGSNVGYSSSASSADISGVRIDASGSGQAVGILALGSGTVTLADVNVTTSNGPGVHDYGLEVGGNASASARTSSLGGTPNSVVHDAGGLGTVRVADTRLATSGLGTVFCLGVFDNTFAPRSSSCV